MSDPKKTTKLMTEELDVLQFGRVLHHRPKPIPVNLPDGEGAPMSYDGLLKCVLGHQQTIERLIGVINRQEEALQRIAEIDMPNTDDSIVVRLLQEIANAALTRDMGK